MVEKRLISIDEWKAFEAKLEEEVNPDDFGCGMEYTMARVNEWLVKQPRMDADGEAHGWWIKQLGDFKCSVCEAEEVFISNYCPNCGVKLRFGGSEND